MVNETKTPVVSREELEQGVQMVDALIVRLTEMRDIATTLLAQSSDDMVAMSHRESIRMVTLRDEIGELTS